MTKVIIGNMFVLQNGIAIVHEDQEEQFTIGEVVVYEGRKYTVKSIVPPTRPDGKWSIMVYEI